MNTSFLIFLLVAFVLFTILTIILEYHWWNHLPASKRMFFTRFFYYGGSLFFLACMGIALTGIV